MLSRKLLDSSSYRNFNAAIEGGRINSTLDALSYLDRAVVIDLREMPQEPAGYIPIIFERIKSIVPGFHFDSLRIELQGRDSAGDYPEHGMIISMMIDGREYRQGTFYASDRLKDPDPYLGMVGDTYYEIVNKWLADEGADYRLHQVDYRVVWEDWWAARYDRIGLVALTAHEKRVFDTYPGTLLTVGGETFDAFIGPRGIERAIAGYRQIGLFDHLTEEQIAEGTKRALTESHMNVNGILRQFPNTILDVVLESSLRDEMYADQLKDMAAATHGAFSPSNIRDDYRVKTPSATIFSFEFGGRLYKTKLVMEEDWIDTKFFDLVNRGIEENIPDGRFYALADDDMSMIFLTKKQYEALRQQRLLRFDLPSGEEKEE